jgi:hypothetical protein
MAKEKFLLYMLAGIFTYQASIFAYGLWQCSKVTPSASIQDVCPEIGKRYDQTFTVMISTTLALLTGAAITKKGE